MAPELRLVDEEHWQISPYLAQSLRVEDGDSVWLHVGRSSCKVIVSCNGSYTSMTLYKQWAADLKLDPGQWHVRRTSNGIRFGPIIGIVCKQLPSRPPAESTWQHYLAAIKVGQGMLLTPEGLARQQPCIHGLVLSQDKMHWAVREMPWPDVLYVRTSPITPTLQALLQHEFPNRHFNTQTLFNKWLVHQVLSMNSDINSYLPPTEILTNDPKLLQSWLEQYSAVYLKPTVGDKGLGVLRITSQDEYLLVEYRHNQQNIRLNLSPTESIRSQLPDMMGTRSYVIQQALDLPQDNQRTLDLRALMQKRKNGLWNITGIWGRQGTAGSVVTNLAAGGELYSPAKLLEKQMMPKARRTQDIYRLCQAVATTLEGYYGQLGEISLDMGIDQAERMWLLEVTGMPGKRYFTDSLKTATEIYAAPMEYSAYLAGFSDVIYPLADLN